MKTIGFIGLGNMGKGMSINLSKEDLIVLGYDINVKSFEDLKHNKIEKINDLKSLTEKSDIIITMLPMVLRSKKFGKKLSIIQSQDSI